MKVGNLIRGFIRKTIRGWNNRLCQGVVPSKVGWLFTIAFSVYLFEILTLRTPSAVWMPLLMLPVWVFLTVVFVSWSADRIAGLLDCLFVPHDGPPVRPCHFGFFVAGVYLVWVLIVQTQLDIDVETQMDQARRFCFYDWHPIIHSLLMAPLLRIYDGLVSVVVFQIVMIALLGGWLLSSLQKATRAKIALGVTSFVIFNPVNFMMIRTGLKDVAFAFAALGVMIALLNVHRTKGRWLCSWKNILGMSLLLFLSSFFRHNGIFFTVPLSVMVLLWPLPRKDRMRLVLVLVLAAIMSWGYMAMKHSPRVQERYMERPEWAENQNLGEIVGVPMSGMLRAYCRDYARTPSDVKMFIESIAPREKLLSAYSGNYNSVKFINDGPPSELFSSDRMTVGRILNMLIRTLKACHMATFKGLRDVTALVWDPFPQSLVDFSKGSLSAREVYWLGNIMLSPPWGWVFFSVGLYMLIFVGLMTFGFVFRGWRAWVFSIPWLCYGFGTMLLLCGPDWRFFYGLILCAPVAAISVCIRD